MTRSARSWKAISIDGDGEEGEQHEATCGSGEHARGAGGGSVACAAHVAERHEVRRHATAEVLSMLSAAAAPRPSQTEKVMDSTTPAAAEKEKVISICVAEGDARHDDGGAHGGGGGGDGDLGGARAALEREDERDLGRGGEGDVDLP